MLNTGITNFSLVIGLALDGTIIFVPPGLVICYGRAVNRNIFYIIGVIVVIIIVLKLLHIF